MNTEQLYEKLLETELPHPEIPNVADLRIEKDPYIDTYPISAILNNYFASRGKYGVLRTPILKVVLSLFLKALEKNGYKIVKER